jgi:hypothetical protein
MATDTGSTGSRSSARPAPLVASKATTPTYAVNGKRKAAPGALCSSRRAPSADATSVGQSFMLRTLPMHRRHLPAVASALLTRLARFRWPGGSGVL